MLWLYQFIKWYVNIYCFKITDIQELLMMLSYILFLKNIFQPMMCKNVSKDYEFNDFWCI